MKEFQEEMQKALSELRQMVLDQNAKLESIINAGKSDLMTISEVRKVLRCCKQTIYNYIQKGKLTKLESEVGSIRFLRSEVESIFVQNGNKGHD